MKIMLVLVGIAALSLSEIALMFWLGGRDVKNFCREIKPGTSMAQFADLAKQHDLRYKLPGQRENSGTYLIFVNTPRSFERHTCIVRHDNAAVIASKFGAAD